MFKHSKSLFLLFTSFFLFIAFAQEQYYEQDDEDYQFQQYATHMTDFNPTQSFEFQLKATEQETLILWPTQEVTGIRGVFYLSDDSQGLFMGVEVHGNIEKTFYNKKLGVFNVPYSSPGDMKLIFKAEIEPVKIYISYQIIKKQEIKTEKKQQEELEDITNETLYDKNELSEIVQKFHQVENSLLFQQTILKSIVNHQMIESKRLEEEMNKKSLKIIIQTIFVIGSGLVSIWMLKRQFKKGYEILI